MNDDPVIMAALLGASRPEALPPAPDPRLAPAWDELARLEPAAALLGALALSRSLRLAGASSAKASGQAESAPAETKELLPEAAVDGLLRMLGGEFREVLSEWLRHAAELDAVAPPRVLPELLDAGRREARLRPALARLAGERGAWIARRHPEYEWLLAEAGAGDEGWEAGRPAERLAWLREARLRDPEGCAARIDEAWAGESPDFREAVARLASEHPLPADEVWLQAKALRERRQGTRRYAAGALSQLTTSDFSRRALERLEACVKLRKKLVGRALSVEPPAAFDPAWADDGLIEKAPPRTGEKAWWLRQIVAAVPLASWSGWLDLEPEQWLGLAVDSDWKEALVLGWIDAAVAAPSMACAAAFLPWAAKLDPWPTAAPPRREVMAPLFESLDPAARTAVLEQLAAQLAAEETLALLAALSEDPPVPGNTTLAVLRRALAAKPAVLTRPEARALALGIPLSRIQAELERLAKLPELSAAAEEFATTLEFRRKLFTTS